MTIKLNKLYHIDEIVLASFCPLTLKTSFRDKGFLFRNHLHSFHSAMPKLYEDTLEHYTAYMVYMIFINSFKEQRLIYEYETYFYNVLRGYMSKNDIKPDATFIAKAWIALVQVYGQIRSLIDDQPILSITYLNPVYFSTRFINMSDNKYHKNFYTIAHIQIDYSNDMPSQTVVILPAMEEILSNINVVYLLDNDSNTILNVVQIDLNSGVSTFTSINPNKDMKSFIQNYKETFYLDVKYPSLFNCHICPLTQCSKSTLLDPLKSRR